MKKLFMASVIFVVVFVLSGCDLLNSGDNEQRIDIWYDEQSNVVNVSYTIPKGEKDPETEEYLVEFLTLEIRHNESEAWIEIAELSDYTNDNYQIEYRFEEFGDYEFRIIATDENGVLLREVTGSFYINEPQFIYHFDAYFDSWTGEVRFNFGLNYDAISNVVIMKSIDGGLEWSEVLDIQVEYDENELFKNDFVYYEYEEGNYVYKIVAKDISGVVVDDLTTWGEINVSYQDKNFEGTPNVWYVGANFNVYDNQVSVWWDSSGDYDSAIVEKSVDGLNWEFVGKLPRIAQTLRYNEDVEGDYTYRVSLLKDDEIVQTIMTEQTTRIKVGAVIGQFDGWIDHENDTVNLNWDFLNDIVSTVKLERKYMDLPYELLGEFGGLKKMYSDIELDPGNYTYKVTVLDENGLELDWLASKEFNIESKNHINYFNAYFDYYSAEVRFDLEFNREIVNKIVIEKEMGNIWEQVIEFTVSTDIEKEQVRYYEFDEGTYSYKALAYDAFGELIGEVNLDYNIEVEYEDFIPSSPVFINSVDASADAYSNMVYINWSAQGDFYQNYIEKSLDLITWTFVENVPRMAQNYNYFEQEDGVYYYRVSARNESGDVLDSAESAYTIRVKEDAVISYIDGWYDWNSSSININWDLKNIAIDKVVLEKMFIDTNEVIVLGEFGNVVRSFQEQVLLTGTYVYTIKAYDIDDNLLDELSSKEFYIEAPEYVYSLNAYFNQSIGQVEFYFNINQNYVVEYTIELSSDGGLTWQVVLLEAVQLLEDNWYVSDTRYYETTEGNYVYRIVGRDINGNSIGTATSWNEITVQYDNLHLNNPVNLNYLSSSYDIYSRNVSLWWGSEGTYNEIKVEKSLDGENWVLIEMLPYVVTYYTFIEETDGNYYYRVSALNESDEVLSEVVTNDAIRVKQDSYINSFYYDYDNEDYEVKLYWSIIQEDVSLVKVERLYNGSIKVVGQYGPLKSILFDTVHQTGNYTYILTLLDSEGNVLDTMETQDFYIEYTE